jgi:hypothetical protein
VTYDKTVGATQLPDATTQINILQRVGGSLGGAVFAVLIANRLPRADIAFHPAFLAVCIGAAGAFVAALLMYRVTPETTGTRPDRLQA